MSSTIKPRTATVTIHQGDYLDEIEHLRKQAEAAQEAEKSAGPRILGDLPESHGLIEKHDALVAEAEAEAIHVKVRNLGRVSYRDLKRKHPPRLDDPDEKVVEADKALGCNEDSFFDELVTMSLLQPEFSSDAERTAFLEDLAPIDWERVKFATYRLNEVTAADPKSFPSSSPTQLSDET